jgi:AcrR family transcriptional regulator
MSAQQKSNPDSRIQKSRESMCKAIFQLLEEDSFTRITVNSICKTAKVSRTTFYQHFRDKYGLIRFALEQATGELQRSSGGSAEREIHNVLDFVYEKRKVFRNLDEQNEELFHLLNDIDFQPERIFGKHSENPRRNSIRAACGFFSRRQGMAVVVVDQNRLPNSKRTARGLPGFHAEAAGLGRVLLFSSLAEHLGGEGGGNPRQDSLLDTLRK